jgi:CHAT domain-containing protein
LQLCLLAAVAAVSLVSAPPGGTPQPPAASVATQDDIQQLRDQATELTGKGRSRDALPLLDRALALAARRGDFEVQARIELQRATAWRGLADPARARAAADRALALARRANHPATAVQALTAIANLLADAGDPAAAGIRLREAVSLAEQIDRRTLASLLELLGRNARALGNNDQALHYLGRAVAAADEAGDLVVGIRARTARSTALLGLGRFAEGLADAEQAFDLAREKEPRMRPAATFSLAQAHAHVWNLDRAAALWTEAIERYREMGPPIGVALSMRQRMDTWYALGEFDRAAEDGAEALALFGKTGSAGTEPNVLARLALIASRRGDADTARRYAQSARAAARPGPDRRSFDNDLGLVALRTGDPDAAARAFDDVLVRSLSLGDPEYQWRARYGLGRVALARGRPDEARAHFEAAVAIVERMRRELPEANLRAAFLSDRNMAYEALVTTLLADEAPGRESGRQALAVAERARSRSLADLLAESLQRLTDARLEAVREEERRFSTRLSALQRKILATSDAAARDALLAELRQAEADYDALVVRVRRENPAHAALVYPEPLSPDAIEALPESGEAIVAYLFDEDRGHAWIVTRGAIDSYSVPAAAILEPQIRLMDALIAAGDTDGTRELARRLFDTLLGPARERLAGVSRMVIIPDGPLHRLSFGLLRTPADQWLLDQHALSLAPSATVLAEMRKRERTATAEPLLAFAAAAGDAESRSTVFAPGSLPETGLRYADAEVRDIARLLDAGAVRRDGPRRREEEIKKATGAYRVLHFATHAVIDEVVPRRSAVLLAASGDEDGLLQMNEIPNLALQAELVVLAACSSHVGRELGGEGLRGLSRAFMRAGSRAVLATLWEVDDAETRKLMRLFYSGLRGGQPPDQALAGAQRAMIRAGGRSADPRVWAAFVVTGDAGQPLFDPAPASWTWGVGAGALAAAALGGLWATRRRPPHRISNRPAGDASTAPEADRNSTNQR